MRRLTVLAALLCAMTARASVVVSCEAQTQPAQQAAAKPEDRSKQKPGAEVLKKYVGRYELEVGIIPISTLDVTLTDGELWVKPSVVKKRRLLYKRKNVFTDEVEGTRVVFGRDDEERIVSLTFQFEGESYTARRVELPPPSLKGNVVFRLKGHADAQTVALAGSFNNWNQSQFLFGREGDEWVCRIDLDPGVYQYKLIVDGNWLLDPANSATVEDEAGNVNNILDVPPKP
jgi:Glycogen recognition site of AMP-activated protein kinase